MSSAHAETHCTSFANYLKFINHEDASPVPAVFTRGRTRVLASATEPEPVNMPSMTPPSCVLRVSLSAEYGRDGTRQRRALRAGHSATGSHRSRLRLRPRSRASADRPAFAGLNVRSVVTTSVCGPGVATS